MKVKEMIAELLKHDQDKQVMIQQGEEQDYMLAYTIKEKELADTNSVDDMREVIVIEYS